MQNYDDMIVNSIATTGTIIMKKIKYIYGKTKYFYLKIRCIMADEISI